MIKFNSLSWTSGCEVHVVHISRVIIAYTLESLSSLTYIDNTQSTGHSGQRVNHWKLWNLRNLNAHVFSLPTWPMGYSMKISSMPWLLTSPDHQQSWFWLNKFYLAVTYLMKEVDLLGPCLYKPSLKFNSGMLLWVSVKISQQWLR